MSFLNVESTRIGFARRASNGLRRVALAIVALLALHASAFATFVTTLNPDGSVLSTINVHSNPKSLFAFVQADDNGNIWLGHRDPGHTYGEYNPRDAVYKFATDGTRLLKIKDTMRFPGAFDLDTSGNIYVAGVFDGGPLSPHQVFRFAPSGGAAVTYPTLADGVAGMVTVGTDVYYMSDFRSMRRYGPTGAVLATREVTGRQHYGLWLSADEQSLWTVNTEGRELQRFDRSMNLVSSFPLPAFAPLKSVTLMPDGNFASLTVAGGLTVFSTAGTILRTIPTPFLDAVERSLAFSVGSDGKFYIAHGMQHAVVPEPGTLLMLIVGAAALLMQSGVRKSRLRRSSPSSRSGTPCLTAIDVAR